MCYIMRTCVALQHFPGCWRDVKIVPIKKLNKQDTNPLNNRPTSLLPALGKLLERLINDRLNKYDRLLKTEQFEFGRGRGTTQQITIVTEGLTHTINSAATASITSLNLEKAVGRVWHGGLIHKLLINGMHMYLMKINSQFLTSRKYRVTVNGTLITACRCITGFHREVYEIFRDHPNANNT